MLMKPCLAGNASGMSGVSLADNVCSTVECSTSEYVTRMAGACSAGNGTGMSGVSSAGNVTGPMGPESALLAMRPGCPESALLAMCVRLSEI